MRLAVESKGPANAGGRDARPPAPAQAGIHFDAVTVVYRGVTALEGLTLDIEGGEVMALLGPSGSGKTTALRSLAGFVAPSSGRIHIGERDVTDLPPYHRDIGMVVQQYALFPHMRVEQNVAFGPTAHRVPRKRIGPLVAEALEMVGMSGYAKRYPRELSGGQQQRVAIARALALRPRVLLLDEPLSALDAQLRSGMLAEIARLHRELPEMTILYVTHDQIEALTLADRIAVMNEARLVEVGTPAELYRRPRTRFTAGFVGNANLLPVTVEGPAQEAGRMRVRLGARELTVTAHDAFAPGSHQQLCIHPHCLSLTPEAGCVNEVESRVSEVQWRGAMHRLFAEVDGSTIKVDTTTLRRPPALGDTLRLYFAAEDAVLVNAEDPSRG